MVPHSVGPERERAAALVDRLLKVAPEKAAATREEFLDVFARPVGAANPDATVRLIVQVTSRLAFLGDLDVSSHVPEEALEGAGFHGVPVPSVGSCQANDQLDTVDIDFLPFIEAATIRGSIGALCHIVSLASVISFEPERRISLTPGTNSGLRE